jgi:hypothetical protein
MGFYDKLLEEREGRSGVSALSETKRLDGWLKFLDKVGKDELDQPQKEKARGMITNLVEQIEDGKHVRLALLLSNQQTAESVREDLVDEIKKYLKGHSDDEENRLDIETLHQLEDPDGEDDVALETEAEEKERKLREAEEEQDQELYLDEDEDDDGVEDHVQKYREKSVREKRVAAAIARNELQNNPDTQPDSENLSVSDEIRNYLEFRQIEMKEQSGDLAPGSAQLFLKQLEKEDRPIRFPEGFELKEIERMLAEKEQGAGMAAPTS